MKKKLLIGLLASLMAFSFAAACGENGNTDNSGSNVNTESSNTGSDTGSEASKYTVTLRNGNPMLGGSVQELEFEAGAALELPTLTEDGKTFKGWFDVDGNAAPATMPEEAIALYAVWEIIPYTLTIVHGETTTEVKFGVDYDFENGIELTVNDLAFFLADSLPAGTEDAAYKWAEEVPAEFALQNYTFTVSEVAPVTVTLVNGPLWDIASTSFVYLAEGVALDLPFLTAEGKIFQGWFSFSYDDEGNEIATPAPETVPAEGIALTAVWEVIPYTISITLPNAEVVTVKIGVEDVYADDPADEIVAYNNPYSIEYKIENALLAYATEQIVYVVELPTNAETGEVEFELKDYEFTATEAERVYTAYMPDYTTVEYKYGDAIALPTPDPIEGATFVKWVYYYEGEAFDVPATASSAIDQVAFKQVWDVTPYTLTLHNVELDPVWNEETQEWESAIGTKTITFGAMTDWEKGIEATPADLAWTVAGFLPENTAEYTYAWVETVPEVFELKNYTFTVNATPVLDDQAHTFSLYNATKGQTYFLNGKMSGYYMATTTNPAEAIAVYAEKVAEGSYKFYYMNGEAKTYISIVASGTYINMKYDATDGVVFKYSAAKNCWYTNINGNDYYPGTYTKADGTTYTTVSASKTSYIKDNNLGVTQFPLEFAKTYSLILRDGNPMLGGTVEELQLEAGEALNLPTLTAEGKTFKGWFAMSDNGEPTVTPPTAMGTEPIALYAVWDVTPYTLKIVNGDTTTEIKFGVENDGTLDATVRELAWILEDFLPANTDTVTYSWAEEVPETFELKDYTFTVVASNANAS